MGKKSLKKNAFYNIIRSMLSFIFPLITYPYITTILIPDDLGKVTFSISVVSYFMLLAVFGMGTYAIKECAPLSGNKKAINDRASELFTFNMITAALSFALLLIVMLFVKKLHPYTLLLLIQSVQIIFSVISVEWVNVVFEDYKYTTIRFLIIDIINLLILFLFVKKSSDYYVYAFITINTYICMSVTNMLYCRRYVDLKVKKDLDFWGHVRKALPFFINDLSVAIYIGADTTMIGFLTGEKNNYYNGIYSVAVKIYTVVKNVFVAIFSVTVYRLTACIAKKNYDEYYKVLNGVTSYFILLAFPAVTGMIVYANYICMIFGNGKYLEAAPALRLLAIALLFAVFGGIATRCINVPLGYEVVNTKVTLIVAIENVLLNFPFIIFFAEKGAAFTTALAEFTVLFLCVLKLKKEHVKLPGLINVKHIRDAIIGCVWICVTYVIIGRIEAFYLIRMIIGIVMSVVGYALVLFAMRNDIFIDIVESKLHLRSK